MSQNSLQNDLIVLYEKTRRKSTGISEENISVRHGNFKRRKSDTAGMCERNN